MDAWEEYEHRVKRAGNFKGTANRMAHKLPDSLSYETILIDGVEQNVAVINSDNYNEKKLFSLPGDHFLGGEIVFFADDYWIITSVDARQDLYARAKMLQCNYLLKWITTVDGKPEVVETHCAVEDGTKLNIASAQCKLCA